MIIPISRSIPFFRKQKTKEELKAEMEVSNHQHSLELRRRLDKDIDEFKQKFKDKDIKRNPYAYALFSEYGHTDIERLSLTELMCLGFSSLYSTSSDEFYCP